MAPVRVWLPDMVQVLGPWSLFESLSGLCVHDPVELRTRENRDPNPNRINHVYFCWSVRLMISLFPRVGRKQRQRQLREILRSVRNEFFFFFQTINYNTQEIQLQSSTDPLTFVTWLKKKKYALNNQRCSHATSKERESQSVVIIILFFFFSRHEIAMVMVLRTRMQVRRLVIEYKINKCLWEFFFFFIATSLIRSKVSSLRIFNVCYEWTPFEAHSIT